MSIASDLESHLGYWLRMVSNQVSSSFARSLAECEVTVAEWVVLRLLFSSETVMATSLADQLGMTRGAITKIIDKLEAKGFVSRGTREDDRRSQSLSLTLVGLELVPRLAALADANDARFFDCLSASERAAMMALLQKLAATHGLVSPPTE